jgi:hypothetical protein
VGFKQLKQTGYKRGYMSGVQKQTPEQNKQLASLIKPKPQGKVLDTAKTAKSERTLPVRGR